MATNRMWDVTSGGGGRKLYRYMREDGLTVQIVDVKGFYGTYVSASFHTGGNDRHVWHLGRTQAIPAGAAHFLEHLIFSGNQNGFTKACAAHAISANASTMHNETIFYSTATGQTLQQLALWLQALVNTQFSRDEVERERPVILAELDMVQNDPSFLLQERLMQSLYPNHPLSDDIAGSHADVEQIRFEALSRFHDTFYRGSSLLITVVGAVDADEREQLAALADATLPKKPVIDAKVLTFDDSKPGNAHIILPGPVDLPRFAFGLKMDPRLFPDDPRARYVERRRLYMWLDTWFGDIAPATDAWRIQDLIDDSFYYTVSLGDDYAMLLFSGYSRRPEEAVQTILDTLDQAVQSEPDAYRFEITKQASFGHLMRRQDSVAGLGSLASRLWRSEVDVFGLETLYANMSVPTQMFWRQDLKQPDNRATVILIPEPEDRHG